MKEYASKPEAELLQQLQRNDEQALAALMRLYYNHLYNYGSRFTADTALIKDCIQEVFISLWQRRETADAILSPRYYFLQATKNKILKALYKHLQPASLSGIQPDYDSFYEFSIEQVIIENQVNEEKTQKIRKTLALL